MTAFWYLTSWFVSIAIVGHDVLFAYRPPPLCAAEDNRKQAGRRFLGYFLWPHKESN